MNVQVIFFIFFFKANLIIENVNFSADPCEDFYQFACGNFVERTRLPENRNSIGTFHILDSKTAFSLGGRLKLKSIHS
jgi:predicted metalloendopeptidase